MKRICLFFVFILTFITFANAQQVSQLSKEVSSLNEIIKKNTKPTNGLTAVFSLDEKNHVLNLSLNKNKPFPSSIEEMQQMFALMPGAIPVSVIASAYGISKNELGSLVLLKSLVDEDYMVKVTITDSNNESVSYEMTAAELAVQ